MEYLSHSFINQGQVVSKCLLAEELDGFLRPHSVGGPVDQHIMLMLSATQ